MLDIYPVTIAVARDAAVAAKTIATFDNDLARQLRRAATSVPLNVAEGFGLSGGNKRLRYGTALGSAREVMACFDVAVAMGYLEPLPVENKRRLDRVIGTLVKLGR